MDIDFDIARMIIDEIIPYSLEYYLGIKTNDDYDETEEMKQDSDQSDSESDEEAKKKYQA